MNLASGRRGRASRSTSAAAQPQTFRSVDSRTGGWCRSDQSVASGQDRTRRPCESGESQGRSSVWLPVWLPNPSRISSSGLSRLDRFGLDQRLSRSPWTALHGGELQPEPQPSYERKDAGTEDTGPLRAVTGGVVPLPLCGTRRLPRCRCLSCLLAGQTAFTPSANPPGKPGLHHAHFPCSMEESWRARLAASLLRLRIPACDARQRQRAGTVQVPRLRPHCQPGNLFGSGFYMA